MTASKNRVWYSEKGYTQFDVLKVINNGRKFVFEAKCNKPGIVV